MGPTFERASDQAVLSGFDGPTAAPSPTGAAAYGIIPAMMRTVVVLAAALAVAAPAGAAEAPRIEGAGMDVLDDARTGFCLRIAARDPESGGCSGTCGRAPLRQRRSNLATWPAGDRLLAGGAVPASVTRGEAELADGLRIGRPQILLRQRAHGRSTTVTSETRRRVMPTPLAPD